jgi:hypothetical protein
MLRNWAADARGAREARVVRELCSLCAPVLREVRVVLAYEVTGGV